MKREYTQMTDINNQTTGKLFIVPTPIGNLGDITNRALTVLKNVDLIIAEDTRVTKYLLSNYSIKKEVISFHNYNEKDKTNLIIDKLKQMINIALVSDAGTPLINDPGYFLVSECKKINIDVIPLPGPCALITALSGSGMTTDKFYFLGFFPQKKVNRTKVLNEISQCPFTTIFYESPHRIMNTVTDIHNVLDGERYIVLARELTKKFESIKRLKSKDAINWLNSDENNKKGEFVLLIEGYKDKKDDNLDIPDRIKRTFNILKSQCSLKQAVNLTAEIHEIKKNNLYKWALSINNKI